MFGRMGMEDREIVCLMGAHTLGRAHKNRSGEGAASTSHTKAGPRRPLLRLALGFVLAGFGFQGFRSRRRGVEGSRGLGAIMLYWL